MEQYENEERGISFGEIFRTIFSQKWLALIIAVAITIVGTVGIYLYGKTKEEYTVTFVMQLPGSGDSPVSYTYPDGTPFHYTEIISVENLEKVKASSEEFASIKTENMIKYGDISIKRELIETATGSGNYESNYTLSVKSSYFKDENEARTFITELIKLPAAYFGEMQIDYATQLSAAEKALTYDDQLDFLFSQISEIRGKYNSFIDSYGGSFEIQNGKTLGEYLTDIDAFIKNNNIDNLKAEVLEKHYVKSEAALDKYKSDLFLKQREYDRKKLTLDRIIALGDSDLSSSSILMGVPEFIELSNSVNQLYDDIEDLQNYINSRVMGGEEYEAFGKKVETLQSNIRQLTDEYKGVAEKVYSKTTTVNYALANVVEAEGGYGLVISVLISLIVGVLVAAVVAYIVGRVKQNKPVKQQSAQVYPEEGQLVLQAAVTKDEEKENKEDK